jgi:hypothetical protein
MVVRDFFMEVETKHRRMACAGTDILAGPRYAALPLPISLPMQADKTIIPIYIRAGLKEGLVGPGGHQPDELLAWVKQLNPMHNLKPLPGNSLVCDAS